MLPGQGDSGQSESALVEGKPAVMGEPVVEQQSQAQFTRQVARIRSPLSQRRTRRLIRFAAVSAGLAAGGVAILALALTG